MSRQDRRFWITLKLTVAEAHELDHAISNSMAAEDDVFNFDRKRIANARSGWQKLGRALARVARESPSPVKRTVLTCS